MRKETVTVKFTPEQISFLNAFLETHIENYELMMEANPFIYSDSAMSKEYSSLKEIHEIVQEIINARYNLALNKDEMLELDNLIDAYLEMTDPDTHDPDDPYFVTPSEWDERRRMTQRIQCRIASLLSDARTE